jgi:hypothetical protein
MIMADKVVPRHHRSAMIMSGHRRPVMIMAGCPSATGDRVTGRRRH